MKIQVFISIVLLSSFTIQGQVTTRLSTQEKKLLKQEKTDERAEEVNQLVNDTLFILEANRFSASGTIFGSSPKYNSSLGSQHGSGMVDPNLYFVKVDKQKITVQTGLMNETDLPGVSGVTMEGKIREFEIQPSRNGKSLRITLDFSSSLGFYRMDCRITNQGLASATLESLGTSASMNFRGQIVNPIKSKIFTGGPVY
jgi:hypothetical protein